MSSVILSAFTDPAFWSLVPSSSSSLILTLQSQQRPAEGSAGAAANTDQGLGAFLTPNQRAEIFAIFVFQ